MKNKLASICKLASLLLLVLSCGTKAPTSFGNNSSPDYSKFDDDILSRINQHRRSKGLSQLKASTVIASEAEKHSQQMASGKTSFGHAGFDARVDRIAGALGPARKSAENVALGSKTPEEVVRGWLNSPGHKQNIEGDFSHTGIGVARNQKGVLYYTQLFIKL